MEWVIWWMWGIPVLWIVGAAGVVTLSIYSPENRYSVALDDFEDLSQMLGMMLFLAGVWPVTVPIFLIALLIMYATRYGRARRERRDALEETMQ